MIRSIARTLVEGVATRSGLAALSRRQAAGSVAILAFHNVVPPEDAGQGDTSLHLPLPRFIQQIERVARTHEIVDLETALSGPGHRPRAVLTFDDAYRGAVTLALPELRKRGLPATVFVAPALLGQSTTWWDDLGAAGLMNDARRDDALTTLQGRAERVRDELGIMPASLPHSYGIATVDELRAHTRDGVTLGSHSWAHEHLPSLTAGELRESLVNTRDWLRSSGMPFVDCLALPYGAGSQQVASVADDIGHSAVLLVRGGLLRHPFDAATVPRINVPAGLTREGLELRTSGIFTR
ncbi:MAG: polysaccharide deacetylase family protein [Candidatus Cloacimonetes bacterium]|nr:polysaccharide deacetylase family protein [Candidatus Cloacimonadota bacterium]